MRILHTYKLYQPDEPGGIPTVISNLANDRGGNAHQSVLVARPYGWGRRYMHGGVRVSAVSSLGTLLSTPLAPGYIPAFMWHARNADIVVHHAPFPLTDLAIILGLPAHVALVIHWHADIVAYPRVKALIVPILNRALRRADKIVVSGLPVIENTELLKPYSEKCEVIPYGIDVGFWKTLSAQELARAEQIRRQYPRHVIAVGRLVPYKGFNVLVRAMEHVNAQATIVGDGPLLGELKQLAKNLGLSHRINFAGRLDNGSIKILFNAAQVLAFPSINNAESFGIVQVEAMAAGLPIVNTQLGTTAPLVARHQREALTIPVENPTALAQALNNLLDDSSLAQRLGASGAIRAVGQFGLETFRTRMAAVFDEAVSSRKRLPQ